MRRGPLFAVWMIGHTLYVDTEMYLNIDKFMNVPLDFVYLSPDCIIYI